MREQIMASLRANMENLPDGGLKLSDAGERGKKFIGVMHSYLKPRYPRESDRDARINYLRMTFGRDSIGSIKDLTIAEVKAFFEVMEGKSI